MVSPVVAKPKDDSKSYLITADSNKGGYMDIPIPASDADKERALTPDVLLDDTVWKNVWFKQLPGDGPGGMPSPPEDSSSSSSDKSNKEDKNEKEMKIEED